MVGRSRIAVVAAMPNELRPFVRATGLRSAPAGAAWRYEGDVGPVAVVATTTGIGTARAESTTAQLLDAGEVEHVVMIGIAGGLAPSRVGDVVVPEAVVDERSGRTVRPTPLGDWAARGVLSTSDDLVSDDAQIERLRAAGVVAMDMETGALGVVCEDRGTPWSVFRAISDLAGATELDHAVLQLARPDGTPDVGAGIRFLHTHPRRWPGLVRLARDSARAARAAATAADDACRSWR
jgi:nucleoside phosphorylase